MSKVQMLRAVVKQRLTAAAEEIFGLFERTIAEYEEEVGRSKEEKERLQRLVDAVFSPQLRLHRADVQQLLVVKEEFSPEQQEWSSSLDQEDPESPHIKEEQQDLWTSQEGEQLQGLEEADTKFTFTPVPVKTEDEDEEKPQSSQLHNRLTEQIETEADGEDCGGPEAATNSDPDTHPEPETVDKSGDSSEPETDDSEDWEEAREPQSGLNSMGDDEGPVSDSRCGAGEKPFSCSDCGKGYSFKRGLTRHMKSHTEKKPFSCTICNKTFSKSQILKSHMTTHKGEKPFSCSVCGKAFGLSGGLKKHMISHTGEKPFSCSVCSKAFSVNGQLKKHMQVHTREKPFSCSLCSKAFRGSRVLKTHMRFHTVEKPYSCSVCSKAFGRAVTMMKHRRAHKKERPFSCSICSKTFRVIANLRYHMTSHTGLKPFRLQRKLDATFSPQLRLHRADIQQLSVVKEEVPPEQQAWSSSLDQEDPEPPRIKEEQEDLWTSQEGKQLQGLEEADTKFTFRNSDPDTHPEPDTVDKPGDSSEPETNDSEDWEETREPQSG